MANSIHGSVLREGLCCPLVGIHAKDTCCEGVMIYLVRLSYHLTGKHLVLAPYYWFNKLPDILALQISTCKLEI